jgi:hypothetical protein
MLNPVPNTLPILYADDTNILVSALSINRLVSSANSIVHLLREWCNGNFLHINKEKTNLVYFVNKNKPLSDMSVSFVDLIILRSDNASFLGVTLDS